jgi:four helix bundle protein
MYRSFKDMPVWQRAMDIAERVHKLSESLPKREDYGFTSQIRRSSLSVPANIAEAFGRKHVLEKVNFYSIAKGSLTETQSHVEYGKRVGYVDDAQASELEEELTALNGDLNKIILSLKRAKLRGSFRP